MSKFVMDPPPYNKIMIWNKLMSKFITTFLQQYFDMKKFMSKFVVNP